MAIDVLTGNIFGQCGVFLPGHRSCVAEESGRRSHGLSLDLVSTRIVLELLDGREHLRLSNWRQATLLTAAGAVKPLDLHSVDLLLGPASGSSR